jgi:hypothetical protein
MDPTAVRRASSSIPLRQAHRFSTGPYRRINGSGQATIRDKGRSFQWHDYNPSHAYAVGADTGKGNGGDHSTSVVIDFSPRPARQVASHANNEIPADLFPMSSSDMGISTARPLSHRRRTPRAAEAASLKMISIPSARYSGRCDVTKADASTHLPPAVAAPLAEGAPPSTVHFCHPAKLALCCSGCRCPFAIRPPCQRPLRHLLSF